MDEVFDSEGLRLPVRVSFDEFRAGRGPGARLRFDDLRGPLRGLLGERCAGGPAMLPDSGGGDARDASGLSGACLRGRRVLARVDLASTGFGISSMAKEISRQ
jgi:hypothetical protein